MTFSSFMVVMLSAIFVAIFGMFYVRKIHIETHKKREDRKVLVRRIESTRMPRMMQALGIGFGNYFYKVPLKEIDEVISHCETCASTQQCDENLKIPELNPSDIDYCPSQTHLSQYSRAKRIQG